MDAVKAQNVLNKIVKQIFGYENPLNLEQFIEKFAFDVRLPKPVTDANDGTTTWTATTNPTKFIKFNSLLEKNKQTDGMLDKLPINSVEELLGYWDKINLRVTQRELDSTNITESDGVSECINIYRSLDIGRSRNILFSDGMSDCEFLAASQRCRESNFCIRLEDSVDCSNSFGVTCCTKIDRCFMMHSCYDMQDSMFCTGLTGKQYCIANMQYSKDEYEAIKQTILEWMLPKTFQGYT
jgi:hypothetical protein